MMSHAYLVVLMPEVDKVQEVENKLDYKSREDAVRDFLDNQLARYSEHLQVPEYDEECHCIGLEARGRARDAAAKQFGSIEAIRASYWALPEIERTDEKWQSLIRSSTALEEKLVTVDPEKDKPDPECTICEGTGTYRSERNPDSKWDWFVIGGRYNGEITRAPRSDEKGFNFGDDFHRLNENMIQVRKLLPLTDNDVPFAIVTPDGQWHEKGELGWWGTVSDKRDDWIAVGKTILEEHKDCFAIGVDYHI
jgi:hypothetical protein